MSVVCTTGDLLPEKPKPRDGREWRTFELSQSMIVENGADGDVGGDVGGEEEQYR